MENNRTKQFVDELNVKLIQNLNKIEYQFNNEYNWPEFDPLRDEICKCLICDLCQASITFTNHLLESFFKTMLIYHDFVKQKIAINENGLIIPKNIIDKYDNLDLSQTLNQSKRKSIITKEEWKILDEYRDRFRNAYSHAEKKKIFKEIKVKTNKAEIEDRQIKINESIMTSIVNIPSSQGIAQVILSKELAFNYFISVDGLIREILSSRSLKKS